MNPTDRTPEQKIAEQIIRKHGQEAAWTVIRDELATLDGWDQLDNQQQARMVAEIDTLIGLAKVESDR